MAKIPTLTTLRVEDFPSEPRTWLPRLFTPLNNFLTTVTNTLQGRVNFVSNIPAQDQTLTFTYNGQPQTFAWTLSLQPAVFFVGPSFEQGSAVTLAPTWSYDATRGVVSVNFYKLPSMETLTVGYSYKVFVRVIP